MILLIKDEVPLIRKESIISSVCGVMIGILGFNFTMVFDIHDYTFDLSLAPFPYLFPKAADTIAYKNAIGEIQIIYTEILLLSHWYKDNFHI
jgi:hypothetical protein